MKPNVQFSIAIHFMYQQQGSRYDQMRSLNSFFDPISSRMTVHTSKYTYNILSSI